MKVVVTTGLEPEPAQVTRAARIAEELDLRLVRRRGSVAKVLAKAEADLVYLVQRERELVTDGAAKLSMQEGVLKLRDKVGLQHPFLRALQPEGAAPVPWVLDATLGLAQDALHVAATLGVPVRGLEASPILSCLVQEGLQRLARESARWGAAAARVTVTRADARAWLEAQAPGSVPVVFLDPMFDVHLSASPGFELLRGLAKGDPLSPELLEASVRAAERRVVVKVPAKAPAPLPGFDLHVRGKVLDYWIVERELA